jgi:hypothetical protein
MHPTTRVLIALTKLIDTLYPNVLIPVFELCEFVKEIQREAEQSGIGKQWVSALGDTELAEDVQELVIGGELSDKLQMMARRALD